MHGILQVPKTAKMGTLEGVFVTSLYTAQMAQFRAMGIDSGPSRHPNDVPFMAHE